MKRSRAELKREARAALLGNYGTACGAGLIYYVVSICIGVIGWIIRMGGLMMAMAGRGSGAMAAANIVLTAALDVVIAVAAIVFVIGQLRICYTICSEKDGRVGDLLFVLNHHPLRFLGVWAAFLVLMFAAWVPALIMAGVGIITDCMAPCLIIGGLVSIVPVIWVTFTYSQAVIAMVEDPERRVFECFCYSRELMRGNRLRLAGLWFSFIGMFLLGYLSLGIGYLWIVPYMACTHIFFYFDLKAGKLPPEFSSGEMDGWR